MKDIKIRNKREDRQSEIQTDRQKGKIQKKKGRDT